MIKVNKEIFDILDSKQNFLIENERKQKGFLYEFDFKTTNSKFNEADIDNLLNCFSNYTKIGKSKEGVKFTVHFTGVKSEDLNSNEINYFKVIMCLTVRKTLTDVHEGISNVFKDTDFSSIILLKQRIIKNKSDATVEEYLEALNQYLAESYPDYVLKQVMFEGKEDHYVMVK